MTSTNIESWKRAFDAVYGIGHSLEQMTGYYSRDIQIAKVVDRFGGLECLENSMTLEGFWKSLVMICTLQLKSAFQCSEKPLPEWKIKDFHLPNESYYRLINLNDAYFVIVFFEPESIFGNIICQALTVEDVFECLFYVVRKLASEKSKREEKKEPESESLADKVSCLASFIHPQKGSAVIYELNERYSIELRHEETSRVVFSCSDYNLALSVCMLITDFPFECFSDL